MKRVLFAIVGTVTGLVALLSFKTQSESQITVLPATSGGDTATSTAPTATTGSSATTPAAPTTAAASANQTIDGTAVQNRYGTVQAQVVVQGTKIVSVSFLQLSARDGRSQQINASSGPILLRETIQVQSANINTVSGATYTSNSYKQSLQSALDKIAK
jgi:uncharacterized protein with FMN-binding domain